MVRCKIMREVISRRFDRDDNRFEGLRRSLRFKSGRDNPRGDDHWGQGIGFGSRLVAEVEFPATSNGGSGATLD